MRVGEAARIRAVSPVGCTAARPGSVFDGPHGRNLPPTSALATPMVWLSKNSPADLTAKRCVVAGRVLPHAYRCDLAVPVVSPAAHPDGSELLEDRVVLPHHCVQGVVATPGPGRSPRPAPAEGGDLVRPRRWPGLASGAETAPRVTWPSSGSYPGAAAYALRPSRSAYHPWRPLRAARTSAG